jgi:hypothetical protein
MSLGPNDRIVTRTRKREETGDETGKKQTKVNISDNISINYLESWKNDYVKTHVNDVFFDKHPEFILVASLRDHIPPNHELSTFSMIPVKLPANNQKFSNILLKFDAEECEEEDISTIKNMFFRLSETHKNDILELLKESWRFRLVNSIIGIIHEYENSGSNRVIDAFENNRMRACISPSSLLGYVPYGKRFLVTRSLLSHPKQRFTETDLYNATQEIADFIKEKTIKRI